MDETKLQLARSLCLKSTHRVRIGAVVVKGKSIVGVGFNKVWKTHPLITKRNARKKLHAEVDAIIGQAREQLAGATIYVYRERRDGKMGNCKPCIDCQAILKEAGVKRAFYTVGEGEPIGEMKL